MHFNILVYDNTRTFAVQASKTAQRAKKGEIFKVFKPHLFGTGGNEGVTEL